MKKYLMTWYGITDFRVSLGLEQTNGPILGALLAEDYTDVIILGFTHPDKIKNKDYEFQQKLADIENSDLATAREFINLFSNTAKAHNHFNQWLEKQLRDAGKKIEVHFHSVNLKHLNDTEGIYEAANQSLEAVASSEGEKLVTLYLSPGTPVMAFVWAFAALRHPNLKKRLIASPEANKPPQTIVLPNEWLEWHGRQVKSRGGNSNQYDVIFHLFGEQRMPSLLGVLQFSSKRHVFVNSKQFSANVMKQFVGSSEFREVAVDPYDPENVRATILDILATMPSNIQVGFNLTGGTKLMYAGALAACRKVNATPFYFNSRKDKVVFLNDFDSVDTREITSVETFIKLNGNNLLVSKSGYWNKMKGIGDFDRKKLTLKLWEKRSKIIKLFPKISPYIGKQRPFDVFTGNISAKLTSDGRAEICIGNEQFVFVKWPEFARYLAGSWLEEYTYMCLEPFVESGLIKDLRIGLEVSFKEASANKGLLDEQLKNIFGETYQELDGAFTDGRRLYIVECKSGNITSEQVMKLQNIVRYFGGIEGRGILASSFPPNSNVVKKKIKESKNLQMVSGNNLCSRQLKKIIQRWDDQK